MNNIDINKLCYDLSLIYAKDSLNKLQTDNPYISKENEKIDYLYGCFESCYSFLISQTDDYFKYLSKEELYL